MVKYVTFWFLLINYVPEHTAVNQLLFSELYSWVDYSVVSLAPAMELCGMTGKYLRCKGQIKREMFFRLRFRTEELSGLSEMGLKPG